MWRDFKTRFDQILKSLERHKVMIREQAEILSIHRSQQDSRTLESVSQLQQRDSTTLHDLARQHQQDSTVLGDLAQQHQRVSDRIKEASQRQEHDSARLGELVRQYMSDRARTIDEARHQATVEQQNKHNALIEWFSMPPGSSSDHQRFCETRSDSGITGSWILKNEKLRNWTEEDPPSSSILWVNGKPGAGMAIISLFTDVALLNL